MKETVKRSLEEINKQEGLSVFAFLCSRALLIMEDTEAKLTISFTASDLLGILSKLRWAVFSSEECCDEL